MFECHITCDLADEEVVEAVAKDHHWKTSTIDGDPVLGQKAFIYLTAYDVELPRMMHRMSAACGALQGFGVRSLREKIEVIIYDRKDKL